MTPNKSQPGSRSISSRTVAERLSFWPTATRTRDREITPLPLPVVLVPHPHVRVEPTVLGGSPYVSGSRVPVRRIYAFFRDGTRVETILKRYPQLGPAKVFDALAFALDNPEVIQSDIAREHEMLLQAGHRPTRSRHSEKQMTLPFDGEPEPDD